MDLKLKITLVPKPFCGKSLQALWPAWRDLRQSLIEQRGRDCQTCGARPERRSDLHADEEWSYDASADPTSAQMDQRRQHPLLAVMAGGIFPSLNCRLSLYLGWADRNTKNRLRLVIVSRPEAGEGTGHFWQYLEDRIQRKL